MFLCTCSFAFRFLQSDAGCHQPWPQLSVSAWSLRVTPRCIESSHRFEALSKAGKRPWRIFQSRKCRPFNGECFQSRKCRPFNAPLQWTAPVVPTQPLSGGSGQALSVSVSAAPLLAPNRAQTSYRRRSAHLGLNSSAKVVEEKKTLPSGKKNLLETKTTRASRHVDGTQVTHRRRATKNGLFSSTRAQTGRASGQSGRPCPWPRTRCHRCTAKSQK